MEERPEEVRLCWPKKGKGREPRMWAPQNLEEAVTDSPRVARGLLTSSKVAE